MQKRNTIQKEMILNAVHEMKSHVTADQVYEYVKQRHPSIGKGTVYRNLNILADEKQIRKVELTDGPDCYDFTLDDHYHIKCIECNGVFDVDMDPIQKIGAYIKNTHNFQFLKYDILFKGICPLCQEKIKEEQKNGK